MTTSSKLTWTDMLRKPEELVTRRTVAVTSEAAAPLVSRPTPTRMARSKTAWSLAESVGTSPMVSHRGARQPADPRSPRPTVQPRAERRLGDGQDWSRRRREAVAGWSRDGCGKIGRASCRERGDGAVWDW